MNKLELTKEQAKEMIYGEAPEGIKVIDTIQTGSGRWESYHKIIVQEESTGRYFSDTYSEGLTEQQENNRWDYTEPNFTEVFPHKKEVIEYKSQSLEEMLLEFIKSSETELKLPCLTVHDYDKVLKNIDYEAEPFDDINGWQVDFWFYWKHKELPKLTLSGSLYAGKYKLTKDAG